MIFMRLILAVLLGYYFLFCFSGGVVSQTDGDKKLRREDIVVRRDRTTIYICPDRKTEKSRKERDKDVVWLRIYNNTIWNIGFKSAMPGMSLKVLELSDGTRISGLTNESVAFPRYDFETIQTGVTSQGPKWGDVYSIGWLPSNTSASFSVPLKYFKVDTFLFLQYNYEWEFTGAIAVEGQAPKHRAYFDIADIGHLSGICD